MNKLALKDTTFFLSNKNKDKPYYYTVIQRTYFLSPMYWFIQSPTLFPFIMNEASIDLLYPDEIGQLLGGN